MMGGSSNLKKKFSGILLACLILASITPVVIQLGVADSWLGDCNFWTYRKPIYIQGSPGAGMDYQIPINVLSGEEANVITAVPNLSYDVYSYRPVIVDGQRYILSSNWTYGSGVKIFTATSEWQPAVCVSTSSFSSGTIYCALSNVFPHCIVVSGTTSSDFVPRYGYVAMYNLTSGAWSYASLQSTVWYDQGWITNVIKAPSTTDIYLTHGYSTNSLGNIIWKANTTTLFNPTSWQAITLPTFNSSLFTCQIALSESKLYAAIYNPHSYQYSLYSWNYANTWTLLKSLSDTTAFEPGYAIGLNYASNTLTFVAPKQVMTWDIWYSRDEGATWTTVDNVSMIASNMDPHNGRYGILIPSGDNFLFFNTAYISPTSYVALYRNNIETSRYTGLNSNPCTFLWDNGKLVTGGEISGYFQTSCDYTIVTLQDPVDGVYLDNYPAKSNGEDIRFTAADGVTPLNQWIESAVNGSSYRFWVKVSANLDTNQTIYMYWGNSKAGNVNIVENVTKHVTPEPCIVSTGLTQVSSTHTPYVFAEYTWSPVTTIIGGTITFNATLSQSSSNVTTYAWNFGDNNATNSPYPTITHSYASPGQYTVTLTVESVLGNCSISHDLIISQTATPTPTPTSQPTSNPASSTNNNVESKPTATPKPVEAIPEVSSVAVVLGILACSASVLVLKRRHHKQPLFF
jgi:hypothetical protein